ncbi:MAG TPA: efflux RND transporter periplasmic adaptor subunit [Candidatus Limnocylindria bacterium]|jgi:hypothetical protein|nr:efflux RND transporter periplasmic adaptor subunit [Candidatus Limnocylindria bacterium]
MKRNFLSLILGLAIGAGLVWYFLRNGEPAGPIAEKAKPAEHEEKGAEGIPLSRGAQEKMGLILQPAAGTNVLAEIRGLGRVLDTALLVQQWNELGVARIAAGASHKEWERLGTLFSQGQNASARALEAGEAAMKRDEAVAVGAEARLNTTWGTAFVHRPEMPELIGHLARMETVVVRIEFPLGSVLEDLPPTVSLSPLADPTRRVSIEVLGAAPSADPLTQGPAFLGTIPGKGFVPGTAFDAFCPQPKALRTGAFIPSSAIVRHEGAAYVYTPLSADHFARRAVTLEQPLADGWLVSGGVTNGQSVVITGAQMLLSTELKGQGGEE